MSKRTVAFYTLGCKVNQYETEAMKALFIKNGDEVVEASESADVYVINTCTVTSVGDKKSRQFIRKAKRMNPEALVAVVGCYAQIAPDEVMALDGVNLVLGTDERAKIVDYLGSVSGNEKRKVVGDIMDTYDFEELQIEGVSGKTRAFLKIQEGCNQYCSYCIIPYARGNIRSREPFNVISEVRRVVAHGYKEIVLTGIHLASYGKDQIDIDLITLLEKLNEVESLERIRLGSLEPQLIDSDFVDRLKKVDKFCDQFHLSMQSGCDTTLKRMNRKYTTAQYMESVRLIRNAYPDAAITTDVIVGFPGETDEHFNETQAFVASVGFSEMHVFKYSKREGTKAYLMPDQIDEQVKEARSQKLIHLAEKMQHAYLEKFIGTEVEVLLEKVSGHGKFAKGNSKAHVTVEVIGEGMKENTLVVCKVDDREDLRLIGRLL
ncbi:MULTISPECIES: tRNA (N(6)-L-threonylcarbamoyladenosine(37)-C(2))-methylthiotransferase MtaB [unclassified Fusibacter]|uniref:tRNA (N(6)-L-threonylcarbamoyladenosine(37)-C(2))- methylthiotransferase MtaB n=1 Tax=unclassified Fusibacter TaxID=2624464 RepID=UPI0010136EE0|nr:MULTISPECIES: tRNA (N(6)-L-threonylcarbamoyladenosine(37)-C(2))-methylthiotransferase MtaB [unclassified Fusibacter]MCK8058102.1 tRNA (N(6)-L-threonylcarbamoyladenosine(37)-C(2))-methylthiotransferase MtaB [Fusibacter sp. A2]NPE20684.1 tRNA (N(6)-L-threonylcarbamoyladenosine(37)-C(2))-methylthiotransferase MtaB [Fusibacter sp. A1]RXV62890.1 tRNA (N(6)-L-threonylcarbamoyladenosine(37)-C(2))-methylthiotransferase MtaB [Fusibacter sp. A1]